jgi:AraC-like DNA-binding protein
VFGWGIEMPIPMPRNEVSCEIRDLHDDKSFQTLASALDGVESADALRFNNKRITGEIIRSGADRGLSIAKWKCTSTEDICIKKLPADSGEEKKFLLLYFLNPAIIFAKKKKKLRISGSRNNILLSNSAGLEFILQARQPFYLFEISFTPSWLMEQLRDADPVILNRLSQYIARAMQTFLMEPFTQEEYKILHELEVCILIDQAEDFFVRSRLYNLVITFFSKVVNRKEVPVIQTAVQYDQLIEAEMLIMENIRKPLSIETIARKVNMSVSSLIRKFRMIHGKSIHEYYVSKKMELARKIILEHGLPVKKMAEIFGYNQPSAFIESFTKQYGYTPGYLKLASKKFSFF